MKSKIRNIIIAGIVLAVIAGGIYFVGTLPDAQPTSSSSTPYVSKIVYLSERTPQDIASVEISAPGISYTITGKPDEWKIGSLEGFTLNQSALNDLASRSARLLMSQKVEDNPPDISIFGLDKPPRSIKIKYTDGASIELLVGNATPSGYEYYAMAKGSPEVYTISSTLYNYLTYPETNYMPLNITDAFADVSVAPPINWIDLGGTVRTEPVRLELDNPKMAYDITGELASKILVMKEPRQAEINTEGGAVFVYELFGIIADGIAAVNPTPEDLERFGLAEPYSTLDFHYGTPGVEVNLSLGGKDENGSYYLYKKGDDVIYTISPDKVKWAEVQFHQMLSTLQHLPHIDTIQSITVVGQGKSYTFEATGAEDDLAAFYNGRQLDSGNYRKFYQAALYFISEEYTDIEWEGEPVLTTIWKYRDDKPDDIVEFIPAETRRVFIRINGEGDYIMRDSYVDKLLKDCEKLINGEPVVMDW